MIEFVLPPGIHIIASLKEERPWMAGSSSAKTHFALLPGHGEKASRFKLFGQALANPLALPIGRLLRPTRRRGLKILLAAVGRDVEQRAGVGQRFGAARIGR